MKVSERFRTGSVWLAVQLLAATAMAVALGISAGTENYLLIGCMLGGAAVALSALNWRRHLLPIILAYVCIEGFVTLITGQAKASYLLKDFLVMVAYMGFLTELVSRQQKIVFRGIMVPMAVLGALGLVGIINPKLAEMAGDRSYLVGLVGLKLLCFYMPLTVLGYYCLDTMQDVRRLLTFMAAISVPVSVVALTQYVQGPESITRWGGSSDLAVVHSTISEYGSHTRAIGTFSSPAMLALFCVVTIVACTARLRMRGTASTKTAVAGCLLLAVAALFASGTRGGMIVTAVVAAGVLLVGGGLRDLTVGIAVGTVGLVFVSLLGEAVLGRVGTIFEASTWAGRLSLPLRLAWSALQKAPLGFGSGCASVGARHVMPGGQPLLFVEYYLIKLVYELGLPGLLAYFWLMGTACVHALGARRRVTDPELRWLTSCLGVTVPVIVFLALFSIALDMIPMNVYLWFLLGIMLKAPELRLDPVPAADPPASAARALRGMAPAVPPAR